MNGTKAAVRSAAETERQLTDSPVIQAREKLPKGESKSGGMSTANANQTGPHSTKSRKPKGSRPPRPQASHLPLQQVKDPPSTVRQLIAYPGPQTILNASLAAQNSQATATRSAHRNHLAANQRAHTVPGSINRTARPTRRRYPPTPGHSTASSRPTGPPTTAKDTSLQVSLSSIPKTTTQKRRRRRTKPHHPLPHPFCPVSLPSSIRQSNTMALPPPQPHNKHIPRQRNQQPAAQDMEHRLLAGEDRASLLLLLVFFGGGKVVVVPPCEAEGGAPLVGRQFVSVSSCLFWVIYLGALSRESNGPLLTRQSRGGKEGILTRWR